MKHFPSRRTVLGATSAITLLALTACGNVAGGASNSAEYPSGPTNLTVGQAAGGSTDLIARALADPKRLCVVERLAGGEVSVSELSREVGCQVPNMSQHLAVLRSAGLVASRREGSTVFYRLVDDRVLDAYRLLQQVAG